MDTMIRRWRRLGVWLLDIQGIDGGGLAECRALRGVTDAPVVIFTSYLTDELWRAAKEAGAADYLLKHIDTDSLCRAVVRLAKEHRAGPRPRGSPLVGRSERCLDFVPAEAQDQGCPPTRAPSRDPSG